MKDSINGKYSLPYWSEGYVDVDQEGDVVIKPHRHNDNLQINLKKLVERLKQNQLQPPLLIRFNEVLHDRVNSLCDAFNLVAEQHNYGGTYTIVYPVKVNQQRRVAEEIIRSEPAASRNQIGLEAGSKPELMAVLALSQGAGSTIICNGYKDREYIRLALIGQKLGRNVFIVIEKSAELALILEESKKLNVTPLIGLRARLSTTGKDNGQRTGSAKSKFGLSAYQILDAVNVLKEHNALDALKLLYFDLGSQITNIRDIQAGLGECARFYSQLRELGAPINTVDVGGGLGIDYEGTRSRSRCSVNYSIAEYAYNVIHTFKEACERTGFPQPNIISQSGRALTAHHAILVADVIDIESPEYTDLTEPEKSAPSPLKDLWSDYQALALSHSKRSILEIYHDACHAISEIHSMFAHGILTLQHRADAEQIYLATCSLVRQFLRQENRARQEVLDELNEKLADKLFVNLSLSKSLPDIRGSKQIFPILPLEGLNQADTTRVVLQDVTCDSDGRVDQYVDDNGIETTLPLPPYPKNTPFMLGFFLAGAYQDVLGDMHNLFGDTDSVDIAIGQNDEVIIQHPIKGDTVDKVLRYVNFDPTTLLHAYQQQLTDSDLPVVEKATLLQELEHGLSGYTYSGN